MKIIEEDFNELVEKSKPKKKKKIEEDFSCSNSMTIQTRRT